MKAKTWIAVLTFVLVVLISSAALANEGAQNWIENNPASEVRERVQSFKENTGEIAAIARGIRDDRMEIIRLREEATRLSQELRQQLRIICEEERPVGEELAAQIREHLQAVRQERLAIGQTLGSLRGFSQEMRAYRQAGNLGGIPAILDGVKEVQRERILSLIGICDRLEQLLELLR